jgi:hypothetical protein
MQVIIYTNENGNVSVCYPTGELPIEDVLVKDCPDHAIIVDDANLPQGKDEFFNAWRLVGSTVSINLAAAKELTKDRLRMEREPLLAEQDILFQRALESNLPTTTIVVEKQRLRDITTLADQATTLTELKELKAGA